MKMIKSTWIYVAVVVLALPIIIIALPFAGLLEVSKCHD